jgi:DNA-binding GntR family transcriptional regulator
LAAALVDQLRQLILSGSVPAGTQLRQDALAEQYGVSRIPVREALFQLEAEGLVHIIPHKGAVVPELSLEEINDVFDLRTILEPRMLAASASRFTAKDFSALDAVQAQFIEAIGRRDVARWGVLNAEFHMLLYSRAPQPRSRQIVASLLQASDRYTRVQLSGTAAMGAAEREHAHLIALCRTSKVPEACSYLVSHIETVRKDLLHVLGNGVGRR